MKINEGAPAKSTRQVYIQATPAITWAVLTDVNNWPTWNSSVARARLEGPLVSGSIFRWKSGGSSIVSTIQEVEQPERITWTGKTFGTTAVHVWSLQSQGSGVLVETSESLDGWLVRLFRSPFQRLLERTLEEALLSLKVAAEKSSHPSPHSGEPAA